MAEKLQIRDKGVDRGQKISPGRGVEGKSNLRGKFGPEWDPAAEEMTVVEIALDRQEVPDPGLEDAMGFSARLQNGKSRVLSEAESLASQQTAEKELAGIQMELDRLLRRRTA
jgi:hypothetical protein